MGHSNRAAKVSSVLLIGDYRQTLTVSRSLKRQGYHVILTISNDKSLCNSSRNIDEVWHCSNITSNEAEFFDELELLLSQRKDIITIFPIGELELRAFSRTKL